MNATAAKKRITTKSARPAPKTPEPPTLTAEEANARWPEEPVGADAGNRRLRACAARSLDGADVALLELAGRIIEDGDETSARVALQAMTALGWARYQLAAGEGATQ